MINTRNENVGRHQCGGVCMNDIDYFIIMQKDETERDMQYKSWYFITIFREYFRFLFVRK